MYFYGVLSPVHSSTWIFEDLNVFVFSCYVIGIDYLGSAPHFIYGHSEEDFARYAENTRTNTSTGSSEKSRNSGGSGSGSGSEQVEEQEREVLYVFMVRSPLPWMLSRHQHHLRYMSR